MPITSKDEREENLKRRELEERELEGKEEEESKACKLPRVTARVADKFHPPRRQANTKETT